ncbi:glycosyltransferase family 4 protein [Rhodocytophaga aerolata]|uniref:Glycosyltransferase family 4 protein n=1 Tax=Rhodocytophaga aerolata TaxID=455078 RepID=A0ABT8R178_9BACT|nr:glycosyltransferase family 4 protein [Rhodocytophaga aerolata]MDO1445149.1 glycosyltransferase family 4 protein [Rhodocytophaga aerolata]
MDFGGAEKLLVNTSNILVKRHTIHIIYLKGEAKLQPLLDPQITLHKVNLGPSCITPLRTLLKSIKPDVIHTHLGHADLIGLFASRNLAAKLFCTMHNVWFKWNRIDYLIFYLYRILFRTVARHCKVTCVSRAIMHHVIHTLGVKKENVVLLPNAIPDRIEEESKLQAREELKIGKNDYVVLFIGRLRIQKSVDTLISSAIHLKSYIPFLKILIVGEGHLREELELLSAKLDLEQIVEFRGVTLTPNKYLQASDVFVLPSVFEGLPTVILEAFRASIPVIASDIDGTNDLIEHTVNGLLFQAKDTQKLAEHIKCLYNDSSYAATIGKSGNKSFKNKYTIEKYVEQLEDNYL